jgi:REP element-mobilizing transposase RayT
MSDPFGMSASIMMLRSRRAAKRRLPRQGELDLRAPAKWGGKREGAGRKKKPGKSDPVHRTRPMLRRYHPVHVVMRVKKGVGRLRKGRAYRAIRKTLVKCLGKESFRVCHISIQANHLHFLVEASDKQALGAGMQRLNNMVARALNRVLGRRGTLFAFRYHATQIKSPMQARHALAYVLNNWRRHNEDETCERAQNAKIDPHASGLSFDGWAAPKLEVPTDFMPLPVSEPRTWLLRVGWRRHGLISPFEVPGPMH